MLQSLRSVRADFFPLGYEFFNMWVASYLKTYTLTRHGREETHAADIQQEGTPSINCTLSGKR